MTDMASVNVSPSDKSKTDVRVVSALSLELDFVGTGSLLEALPNTGDGAHREDNPCVLLETPGDIRGDFGDWKVSCLSFFFNVTFVLAFFNGNLLFFETLVLLDFLTVVSAVLEAILTKPDVLEDLVLLLMGWPSANDYKKISKILYSSFIENARHEVGIFL